jgi:hypothetical protein
METYSLRGWSTSMSYFSKSHIITSNKSLVDLACGGVLMEKNSEEAIEAFDTLSKNS